MSANNIKAADSKVTIKIPDMVHWFMGLLVVYLLALYGLNVHLNYTNRQCTLLPTLRDLESTQRNLRRRFGLGMFNVASISLTDMFNKVTEAREAKAAMGEGDTLTEEDLEEIQKSLEQTPEVVRNKIDALDADEKLDLVDALLGTRMRHRWVWYVFDVGFPIAFALVAIVVGPIGGFFVSLF